MNNDTTLIEDLVRAGYPREVAEREAAKHEAQFAQFVRRWDTARTLQIIRETRAAARTLP